MDFQRALLRVSALTLFVAGVAPSVWADPLDDAAEKYRPLMVTYIDQTFAGSKELKEKIDRKDKFLLVETLPAQYYNHDHLPGAVNLPPDQIAQLAPKVLPDKTAEIVVYCAKLT